MSGRVDPFAIAEALGIVVQASDELEGSFSGCLLQAGVRELESYRKPTREGDSMKRDFDLIRELLIHFEEKPGPEVEEETHIDGYSDSEVKYHLRMLYEAELLNAQPVKTNDKERVIYVLPFDLTWHGHEFLDSIRDDGRWRKVKSYLNEKGEALTFHSIKLAVGALIKGALS